MSASVLVLYLPLQSMRVAQHESHPRLAGEDRIQSQERYLAVVQDAVPEWLACNTLDALKQNLIAQRHASPQPSPVARGSPESPLALTLGSIAWDSPSPEASADCTAGATNLSVASPVGRIAPSISQDRQAPPLYLAGCVNFPDIRRAVPWEDSKALRGPPGERNFWGYYPTFWGYYPTWGYYPPSRVG